MGHTSHLSGHGRYRDQLVIISGIPKSINFSDPEDKAPHDRMVALVEQMPEIRFLPSGKRQIQEELIRVLRCLNKKLQDAKLEPAMTLHIPVVFFQAS